MPMTLVVPDEIAHSAYEIAATTGDSAENLLLKTLYAHFPPISPELQAEFDAWERLSDEDMARLNEREGLGWHEPKSTLLVEKR